MPVIADRVFGLMVQNDVEVRPGAWPSCSTRDRPGAEKRVDDRSNAFRIFDQFKMPARVYVKLAPWYQPVHDPRIDQRDDRVVISGQDQGGRPQPRQPRQTAPAEAGQQLIVIAPGRAQVRRHMQQLTGRSRVVARTAPVKLACDTGRVFRVLVASRGQHPEQDLRTPRYHEYARASCHQREAPHSFGMAQSELLREDSSP